MRLVEFTNVLNEQVLVNADAVRTLKDAGVGSVEVRVDQHHCVYVKGTLDEVARMVRGDAPPSR